MKYIRVASDLHLEQFRDQDIKKIETGFLPVDERDSDSVLVLAGDISSIPAQLVSFISTVENRFMKVVYVPGNHEFYKHEMNQYVSDTEQMFVHQTGNTHRKLDDVGLTIIDNVRFIYGTLWGDGGGTPLTQFDVSNGLWDFRIIRLDKEIFTVPDMVRIHKQQKALIDQYLRQPFDGKTVVVSHHMPSYRLCAPRFGNETNGGFASNCDDILASDYSPDIWIHGHTHDTIDTILWNVNIICNPAGYNRERNGSVYNSYGPKFIEII